jgi:hypothetical protein
VFNYAGVDYALRLLGKGVMAITDRGEVEHDSIPVGTCGKYLSMKQVSGGRPLNRGPDYSG